MARRYIDDTGLAHLWSKVKAYFPVTVSNGGTGAATAAAARANLGAAAKGLTLIGSWTGSGSITISNITQYSELIILYDPNTSSNRYWTSTRGSSGVLPVAFITNVTSASTPQYFMINANKTTSSVCYISLTITYQSAGKYKFEAYEAIKLGSSTTDYYCYIYGRS